MSIQKELMVRYLSDGHVRFAVPERLCDEVVAARLSTAILAIEGVYRVKLFTQQGKLSIRYQSFVCDFKALAQALFQLLAELELQGLLEAENNPPIELKQPGRWHLKSPLKKIPVPSWVAEKYHGVKETVQAAKVITKLGLKKPKAFIQNPEKAVIDFLNDILVLYLIKLHWERITQEWIPKPWVHRNHWVAVFYLFYLLVRSRRPK